jgi:hypothetical protein
MSANTGSAVPISWDDLVPHLASATQYLRGISYASKRTVDGIRRGIIEKPRGLADSRADEAQRSDSIAILSIAKAVNRNDELLDELINSTLSIVRTGLQIALYVAAKYAEASGFTTLKERAASSKGRMASSDEAEWAAKQETQAAITVFVLAYYVCWRFESKDENKVQAEVDYAGLPEPIAVGNQIRSIGCALYHWGSYLKSAQTPAQFRKLTELYFADVLKEMQSRASAFNYTDAFVNTNYKLDATTFILHGFQAQVQGGAAVEFKRVEVQQIVGNHEMKRKLKQLAQTVVAYDFERRMNPMMDFEALTWLGVLQGSAGTGKSMGLSLLQTMVHDHCKALELPFQLRPIPNAIVQSLQGESAKVYEDWWRNCFDPNYICVAPVDDSEAVYLDRRSHSSSEGSKLIVMSHLRLTEGSTAVNYGNVLQPHATNNADLIDPPVFSRYQFRIVVPGAETRNDFCDQMKLWGDGLNRKSRSEIIRLRFPTDYKFLSDQGLVLKDEQEQKVGAFIKFKNEELARLWEEVERKKLTADSYDIYGTFFAALRKRYEQFTSRDVRNITMNAAARLFSFDFPQDWLIDREALVAKDYDTKKAMILEAALAYQKGLTVAQVLFQEMVHYVETTIGMLDSGRQYRIRRMADEIAERNEAMGLAARSQEPQRLAAE